MAQILEYLKWRGDITFQQSGFNEVDNLILSVLSYIDFSDIVSENKKESITLEEAYQSFTNKNIGMDITKLPMYYKVAIQFLREMVKTKRFSQIRISNYIEILDTKKELQFGALTILLPDGYIFISYRGTDDTLVGWKEDFNLTFLDETPAQKKAVQYLESAQLPRYSRLFLGGHSKGGNLAIYAAIKCKAKVRKKIIAVYNNDGPGFKKGMITEKEYQNILPRIRTILPESSIIGRFLERKEECKIIASVNSGIMQHSPDSWEVLGTKFVSVDGLSSTSDLIQKTITDWLEKLDNTQRSAFLNTLFQVFYEAGIYYITDFAKLQPDEFLRLMKLGHELDAKNDFIMKTTMASLWEEGIQKLKESIKLEKFSIKSSIK